jgi:F-type H+-transporting ATPase subunit b
MQLTTAAALFLETEEPAAESGGFELLLAPGNELFAGITAAVIIFVAAWKWFLPGLNEKLEARQAAISDQLKDAENAKNEAEAAASEYKASIAGAKEEANALIEDARVSAEAVRADTLARAGEEAEEILNRAREEAAAEAGRALQAAKADVASISLDLAEKVVGQSLDRKAQKGLVDAYLADLEKDA